MRKIALALVVAISLGGCATLQRLEEIIIPITHEITNPIGPNELFEIEAAYAVAVRTSLAYRRLPLCRTGEVETLTNPCARRSVVVQMQAANAKVRPLLAAVRRFVRENDQVSAMSAARAVWHGLAEYRNAVPAIVAAGVVK